MRRALALSALLLVLAPAAGAGVPSPQSGWYAGNPLLGPNSLFDAECAGDTCYATGDFGAALKSTDGGTTWFGLRTGVTVALAQTGLAGGQADKVLAAGVCLLLRSDDGGATFRRLPVEAEGADCASKPPAFSFPTSAIGYVLLADGTVLATDDAGATFTRRTSLERPGPNDNFGQDIWCTTDVTCFAITNGGLIERTDDGARSWTVITRAGPQGLNAVRFTDPTTGWAVGPQKEIVRTTDGGATWQEKIPSVPSSGVDTLTGVSCAPGDPQLCMFATAPGFLTLRTTDGGETYSWVAASNDAVYATAFVSSTRVVAVGVHGTAGISDDAGAGFAATGPRVKGQFGVLRAASATTAFAVTAPGVIAHTTDSGQSWSEIQLPNPEDPEDIADIASPDGGRTIFALAGIQARLEKSTDGGATWHRSPLDQAGAIAIVAFNNKRLLLVSPHELGLSTDGGATFQHVDLKMAKADSLLRVDRAGQAVFAYGRRGLLESLDRGMTWRHLRLPRGMGFDTLRSADFLTPRVGYLMTTRARLFKTRDAGHHWKEIFAKGAGGLDIAFSDPRHGYIAAPGFGARYNGVVMRTSDGGATWRPQIVAPDFLSSVATAGSTAYALAGQVSAYATRTGGDIGTPSRLTFKLSRHRVKRGKTVTLRGRLTPARPDAQVVLSMRSRGRWITRVVRVASNGNWTFNQKLARTTGFIAQALGDATHAGAGTHYVVVAVR